jgi:hypothetical protein
VDFGGEAFGFLVCLEGKRMGSRSGATRDGCVSRVLMVTDKSIDLTRLGEESSSGWGGILRRARYTSNWCSGRIPQGLKSPSGPVDEGQSRMSYRCACGRDRKRRREWKSHWLVRIGCGSKVEGPSTVSRAIASPSRAKAPPNAQRASTGGRSVTLRGDPNPSL